MNLKYVAKFHKIPHSLETKISRIFFNLCFAWNDRFYYFGKIIFVINLTNKKIPNENLARKFIRFCKRWQRDVDDAPLKQCARFLLCWMIYIGTCNTPHSERKEEEELGQLCANYLIDTNRTIFSRSRLTNRSNNKRGEKRTVEKKEEGIEGARERRQEQELIRYRIYREFIMALLLARVSRSDHALANNV